ncbi:MAG: zinc metalloprotease HtpX [Armatimonadetes bacterium]|nr:zinc metalloprotease HtpX [Armatimonadota bacterium]
MSSQESFPERQQAEATFLRAMEQAQRGHLDRAIELAEEAVEYDDTFLEARRWLAEVYEQIDDRRQASRHLQALIHANKDDEKAWQDLERVDPNAAARLKRVAELGPDPFVAARQAAAHLEDLLEDVHGVEEEPGEEAEPYEDFATHTATTKEEAMALLAEDEETEEPRAAEPRKPSAEAEEMLEQEPAGPPGARGRAEVIVGDLQPWEYEQDRPYRQKFLEDHILAEVVRRIEETWEDPDQWQTVLADCAHASKQTHTVLFAAADEVVAVLGGPAPMLLIAPEGIPHIIPIRQPEFEIAAATGLLRVLQGAQLVFAVGRCYSYFLSGNVALLHATLVATDRPPTVMGICEQAAKEYLWDIAGSWFESQSKPERERAAGLAHAWQLRCELSADRAGLLACGNVEAACDAIAKMSQHTAQQAAGMTWRALLEKHKDKDPAQLAAIPVKQDPRYSDCYAVYRIRAIRWWATTDQYKALAAQYRRD